MNDSASPSPSGLPTGLNMAELLALPESDRRLLLWMQRQPSCTLEDVQGFLQQEEAAALETLRSLEQQRYVDCQPGPEGRALYRVRLSSMRQQRHRQNPRGPSSTAAALFDRLPKPSEDGSTS